jgi:Ca-activated chloride channel family protein
MPRLNPAFYGVVLAAWTVACTPIHDDTTTVADELSPDTDEFGEIEDDEVLPEGEIDPSDVDDQPRCWTGATPTETFAVDEPFATDAGGRMMVRDGEKTLGLPLVQTSFDTVVTGTIAETSVTQVFGNPFDHAIEAVYVFPLPDDGAVDDYWMRIDERTIHGIMKTRDDARETYENARQQGKSAALLEQERPNIFTQSVANIPPGESIEVEMHVVQPLHQENGRYELALPTVVGPRFIPGAPKVGQPSSGGGRIPDTDRVPDASRITPPVVPPGKVSCAKLDLSVVVDAGMPIQNLRSKYHTVDVNRAGHSVALELAREDELPNRDFVLSWEAAGKAPQASLMTQRVDDDGYFTLTIQPPESVAVEQARGRELIFVVDNSGSMSGRPIETAKDAMRYSLNHMGPNDAFQVVRFSEAASALGPAPLPNTPENVKRGLQYVDDMAGMGGTQMIEGIKAALEMPHEPDRMRIVLFMTDGYIGNEREIFDEIDKRIDDTRLFSLGVGNSVNRYLLDGMSKVGRGAVTYMGLEEKPDEVVDRFYERIDRPVLTDVEIDWGDLPVTEVVPARVPDLFAGQPVVVFGRLSGKATGAATLRGRQGGKKVEMEVPFETAGKEGGTGLASMWARKKIDDLLGYPNVRSGQPGFDDIEKTVTALAIERRIMTEYTSFVAVDEKRVANPDGTYETVQVPVEQPEGVDYAMTVGNDDEDVWGGMTGTAVGSSYGVGGLGLVGTGRGGGGTGVGYGRGAGAGFGGKGKRVPRVRQAKATVKGSLDKDIIRRIVRAHINEVRACYDQGLLKDPNLAGRLVIEFVIDRTGTVTSAKIVEDALTDAAVGQCLAKRAARWKFPSDSAGVVVVRYPFVLSPG